MRPILFDTNAYASFKRNEPDIVEVVQHEKKGSLSLQTICGLHPKR